MKSFKLFFGASGQFGTYDVTQDYHYQIVVNTVEQFRNRLLQEEVLRQSFLHIFKNVYKDNTEDLKPSTPIADHIPNMSKIREIRRHPPTDADVVKFLTTVYPDIYMAPGDFGPERVDWGETWSGRGEAEEEKIMINCRLVQLWLQSVSKIG